MRKIILVIVFTLLAYYQVMAQAKPFIGYDKVAWGASVADVRKAYNLGNNIVLEKNENDPNNIVELNQENVSEFISKRTFLFNRWNSKEYRLYRVVVYYKDGSDATLSQLKGILEERYGNATGTDRESGTHLSVPYIETIHTFGRYAPDIEVQLFQVKYERTLRPEICVYYTWKKFRDEYQATKPGIGL